VKRPGTFHTVAEDEDITHITAEYGIKDWQRVWNDSKNEDLRNTRPNPHVLYKGDQIWIPTFTPKTFEAQTGQVHVFVLYPPKVPFNEFLLTDEGRPWGGVRYEIWINGAKYGKGGRTREDGLVFEMIPVVKELELRVWYPVPKAALPDDDEIETSAVEGARDPWSEPAETPLPEDEMEVREEAFETFRIQLGHFDPAHTPEGVRDRLVNLGYDCTGETGPIGPKGAAAIKEFQRDYGIHPTGKIDFGEGSQDETFLELLRVYDGVTPGKEG
jgi:hypothetical protein